MSGAASTTPDLFYPTWTTSPVYVFTSPSLAESSPGTTGTRAGKLVEETVEAKVDTYQLAATNLRELSACRTLSVETMGGLVCRRKQLILAIPYAAHMHTTWRDAERIGTHLLDAIAIAVRCCSGTALRRSRDRERETERGK